MISFALDGITSFSVKPLKIISNLGILVSVLSVGGLIYALISYFTGNAVAGWTATVSSIWLLGGIQLLCIGVVGGYVGKIYSEVKARPRYRIEEKAARTSPDNRGNKHTYGKDTIGFLSGAFPGLHRGTGQDRKQYNRCSFLRGVAMLCVIGACVAGYVQNQPLFYGAGALALLAFVWLIGRHRPHCRAANAPYRPAGRRKSVPRPQRRRLEGFPGGRRRLLVGGLPAGAGPRPLWQGFPVSIHLRREHAVGRDCLADWLKRGCGGLPEWNSRREAVEELAEKQHFSAEYQAFALPERDAKKGTTSDVWDRFLHTEGRRPVFRGLLLWVLPVLTLLWPVFRPAGILSADWANRLQLLALVQLGTALLCLKGHNQQFGPVYRFHKMVLPYRKLAARFAQETFVSGYLRDLQDRLQQNGGAQQALKELEQISGSIAARHTAWRCFSTMRCSSMTFTAPNGYMPGRRPTAPTSRMVGGAWGGGSAPQPGGAVPGESGPYVSGIAGCRAALSGCAGPAPSVDPRGAGGRQRFSPCGSGPASSPGRICPERRPSCALLGPI